MIRLVGILTGSALAVAAIVIIFGVPELVPGEETLRAANVAEEVMEPVAEPVAELVPETIAESVAEPVSEALAESVAEPVSEALAEIAPEPALPASALSPAQHWYAFWSPFRSEIAADGFISELQRTTGLDYRVVKLKPGVYEVAFAYSDPLDRDSKLDRIAAATGLDMSGG